MTTANSPKTNEELLSVKKGHDLDVKFVEMLRAIRNSDKYDYSTYFEYKEKVTNNRKQNIKPNERFFFGYIEEDLINKVLFRNYDFKRLVDSRVTSCRIVLKKRSYVNDHSFWEASIEIPDVCNLRLSEASGWSREFMYKFVEVARNWLFSYSNEITKSDSLKSRTSKRYTVSGFHHFYKTTEATYERNLVVEFSDPKYEDVFLNIKVG